MKAFIQKDYGPPEQLTLTEVPVPRPRAGEVLVKIYSAAVNDYDWAMVTGIPRIYRLLYGLRRPKHPIPGMELSGTVSAVGPGFSRFAPGDAVYGDLSDHGFGTYAEYVCIKQEALVPKPVEMSFDEAAAIPHATMLAWQGLVEVGKLQTGERLLVNGGGGGVGTFALQMAKHIGASVTGVDTGPKLAKMLELGFDEVIDFKQDDFTRSGRQYDLILDCKSSHAPFALARVMAKGGRYVTVGGTVPRLIQILLFGWLVRLFTGKSLRIVALKPNRDLDIVRELFIGGKLVCVLDGPHSMKDAPGLLRRFGEGGHCGKIVMRADGLSDSD